MTTEGDYQINVIIDQVDDLIEVCLDYRDKMIQKYDGQILDKYGENDPRVGCFIFVSNYAIIAKEILGFYRYCFGETHKVEPLKMRTGNNSIIAPDEDTRRVIYVTKWFFTDVIFIIETSIRRTMQCILKSHPQDLLAKCCSKRSDFWECIGKRSIDKGIMSLSEAEIGKFIIEVRNCVVHNNAFADNDREIIIGQRKFELRKDQMFQAEIDAYIFLSRTILDWFSEWVQKI